MVVFTEFNVANEATVVIYEGLYFDLAQGQMNGAPNETRMRPQYNIDSPLINKRKETFAWTQAPFFFTLES